MSTHTPQEIAERIVEIVFELAPCRFSIRLTRLVKAIADALATERRLRHEAEAELRSLREWTNRVTDNHAAREAKCPWKTAIIDAAVVDWTYQSGDETNPKGAVGRLLAHAAELALDPAVSEGAQTLLMRGRAHVSGFNWSHLRDVLCHVSQIFNGWRGPDWTEFDETTANAVIEIRREIDVPPLPAVPSVATPEGEPPR